ncbi:MAG: hypothetical protein A2201_10535 [Alicyclobacillus sp. RIFOXYA1_FULL_53_8]|nr:MAG: hypothetical protein A2201_10535 [Alicyclobacillus sp. RIFOXYA1_FULL_53_8]
MRFQGLYTIALTPFTEQGEVDEDGIVRLVDFYRQKGVQGITVLGIMGEVHKLSDSERLRVMQVYLQAAQGIPVVVGCSAQGTHVSVGLARAAEEAGAAGIMISAPIGVRNEDLLFSHFADVAQAVTIPIVIQDEPVSTGVTLTPRFLARLANELRNVRWVKVEEPPTPTKVTAIRTASGGTLDVFGGLGGLYFYEELLRGAVGVMTGFAYPDILVRIYDLFERGDHDQARAVFYQYLPLIRFESQLGVGGVGIRKETFRLRNVIQSAYVRPPSSPTDAETLRELADLVHYLGLDSGLTRVLTDEV